MALARSRSRTCTSGTARRGTSIRPRVYDAAWPENLQYDLMGNLLQRRMIDSKRQPGLTRQRPQVFAGIGIDTGALEQGRRPLCRTCLDWSERDTWC